MALKDWKKVRQGKYEVHYYNENKRFSTPINVLIERASSPDFPKSKFDVWVVRGDSGVIIYHATSMARALEEAKNYMRLH